METFNDYLVRVGACAEAKEWAEGKTAAEAWQQQCDRVDWLLWWAARELQRPVVVLATVEAVRLVLRFVPEGEEKPRLALEAAERWGREPNEEHRAAAKAAGAAAGAAADASWASGAAARTARAAWATGTVDWTAWVFRAARAAGIAGGATEHQEMCEVVRGMLPQPWREK